MAAKILVFAAICARCRSRTRRKICFRDSYPSARQIGQLKGRNHVLPIISLTAFRLSLLVFLILLFRLDHNLTIVILPLKLLVFLFQEPDSYGIVKHLSKKVILWLKIRVLLLKRALLLVKHQKPRLEIIQWQFAEHLCSRRFLFPLRLVFWLSLKPSHIIQLVLTSETSAPYFLPTLSL